MTALRRLRFASTMMTMTLGLTLTIAQLPAAAASIPTGQVAFGQATVEPATNDADGSTVFLLTPNHVPFPSVSNPTHSFALMYIPMYPATSTIDPRTLNCTPTNCDHLQTWTYSVPVLGHDHLIGVKPTGDFNVAWHVIELSFTPKGFGNGAINTRIMTLAQVDAAILAGDVVPVNDVAFNCSIVSQAVYDLGTPLHF